MITDHTVRMRTIGEPSKAQPNDVMDAKTTRVRPVDAPVQPDRSPQPLKATHSTQPTHSDQPAEPVQAVRTVKPVPRAISAFDDSKTVRHRVVDAVAKPLPSAIADRIPRTTSNRPTKWAIARVLLVLLIAAMPILAIPVEVFGLVSQGTTSIVLIALIALLVTFMVFAPHRIDIIVGRGLIAGMVACIVYDGARLFAVHVLGLMGDFIMVMGSFVTGEPGTTGSAAVGYIWRYIGDAGGLGIAFFVIAFALGIDRWSNVSAVAASVAFAVFPTWTGLIATVAIAPHGEEMMFPLNWATLTITLVGHVIFGFFVGLAFLKMPRGGAHREWPWRPLLHYVLKRR
jgi:hypothetical protein